MDKIPLSFNEIDFEGLSAILRTYHGRHHQDIVADFEREISQAVGGSYVAAVQSGTAALHLALRVVGVQPRDFVLVPSFAYVATVSPVKYVGATPIFIDSERVTWNMDPVLLERSIADLQSSGKKIGAIVVVHNYGMPAQMDTLLLIARKWGIPLIEDAAESFGSKLRGKWTGTLGDVGVLSFNSNKTITGFGGGALVSSNNDHITRATYLASHARSDVPYYQHDEVGYNYRMSPLTAAYGLLQLTRMGGLLRKRQEVFRVYRKLGEPLGFQFQETLANVEFQPWLTACILPRGLEPESILERLAQRGFEGRRMWKPLHLQPAFQPTRASFPVSESLFEGGFCFPMTLEVSNAEKEAQSVFDAIIK